MEYLMTYGWAILAIAIVMVSLYSLGIFNLGNLKPTALPGSCQVIRTAAQTSLAGQCSNMIPKYVAYFTGSTAYVSVPSNSNLNLNSATFSFWLYPIIISAADIIERGVGSGAFQQYYIRYTSSTQFQCVLDNGVRFYSITATDASLGITANRWNHIACVVNDTGNMAYLYVNGILKASASPTSSSTSKGSSLLYIGGYSWDGYSKGYMADAQIYNASLDNVTVNLLYKEGIGGGADQSAAPCRVVAIEWRCE
ncbi:MAG: LamG domain-containing protein [Candidatus Micrarchaeota archaeon]|nr:LamG domain-containing protein [Candidatus Micrarchaeota archaeon]MDE1849305.1 LamG domain-containing protein [Candidatus Micrarchaeota archaeon]